MHVVFKRVGGGGYNFSKVELSQVISKLRIRAVWNSNTG